MLIVTMNDCLQPEDKQVAGGAAKIAPLNNFDAPTTHKPIMLKTGTDHLALLARLRKEQSIKANSSVISDHRDLSSLDDEEEGEEELSELEETKEEKKEPLKKTTNLEVKKPVLPRRVVTKKR